MWAMPGRLPGCGLWGDPVTVLPRSTHSLVGEDKHGPRGGEGLKCEEVGVTWGASAGRQGGPRLGRPTLGTHCFCRPPKAVLQQLPQLVCRGGSRACSRWERREEPATQVWGLVLVPAQCPPGQQESAGPCPPPASAPALPGESQPDEPPMPPASCSRGPAADHAELRATCTLWPRGEWSVI